MEIRKIKIGDKSYKVKIAKSMEDKTNGLQNINELPSDEGMLFIYDTPQKVGFWMKDTNIELDIIFINENKNVISKWVGKPESEDVAVEENVSYVLEVNSNSGIEKGDSLTIEENNKLEDDTMKVLTPDGEVQMELDGGERIFSRKNTKTLITMAKRARKDPSESRYKALGKKIFEYIDGQDTRDPEYVDK